MIDPAISFVENNDTKLWTSISGQGTPVSLTSGGPGCCDYMGPVAEMIDDLCKTVRWEPRGCGRSTSDGKYDLNTAVSDLDHVRSFLGFSTWTVIGHSWGANFALSYALKYPNRVKAVIYLSGTGITREWHEGYRLGKGTESWPEFEFPTNMEVNRVGNESMKAYQEEPGLPGRIASLDIPFLFIHGSKDIRWPVSAEKLCALLPQARFEIVDGAEHFIWLSHGRELSMLIRNFITSSYSEEL